MSLTFNKIDDPIAMITNTNTGESSFVYVDTSRRPKSSKPSVSYLDIVYSPEDIDAMADFLEQGRTFRELGRLLESNNPDQPMLTHLELETDETIEVMPSFGPERISVSGQAGLGKSTKARQYAQMYKEIFPDNKIWLFVRQKDDPAFEGIEVYREIVVADQEPEDIKALDIAEFKDSLVIIDDTDNLPDKAVQKAMLRIINDLFTNSRKNDTTAIYISHKLLDGAQSAVVNNEANKIFMFPSCNGTRQIEKFLGEHASLKKKKIDEIIEITKGSRWLCLCRQHPGFIIYEHGIFLL